MGIKRGGQAGGRWNSCAVELNEIGGLDVQDTPLKAVQMLWVNLLMDSLASLSLATERPSTELLGRRPYKYSQPLLSLTMLWHIVSHALYQLAVLLALVFAGQSPCGRACHSVGWAMALSLIHI